MHYKKLLITVITLAITMNAAMAQKAGAAGGTDDVEAFVQDTKTDLLIVVAGGLAGAVLGLSTLSFVDEPKEHTRNILVGASLGIILGVGYVAFNQANRSRSMFYEEGEMPEEAYHSSERFDTLARVQWHDSEVADRVPLFNTLNQIGYTFTY